MFLTSFDWSVICGLCMCAFGRLLEIYEVLFNFANSFSPMRLVMPTSLEHLKHSNVYCPNSIWFFTLFDRSVLYDLAI
jgi:hypothetical protein